VEKQILSRIAYSHSSYLLFAMGGEARKKKKDKERKV
jgi:hypothetical protein